MGSHQVGVQGLASLPPSLSVPAFMVGLFKFFNLFHTTLISLLPFYLFQHRRSVIPVGGYGPGFSWPEVERRQSIIPIGGFRPDGPRPDVGRLPALTFQLSGLLRVFYLRYRG